MFFSINNIFFSFFIKRYFKDYYFLGRVNLMILYEILSVNVTASKAIQIYVWRIKAIHHNDVCKDMLIQNVGRREKLRLRKWKSSSDWEGECYSKIKCLSLQILNIGARLSLKKKRASKIDLNSNKEVNINCFA